MNLANQVLRIEPVSLQRPIVPNITKKQPTDIKNDGIERKKQCDKIISTKPSTRKVRKFIREWLNEIDKKNNAEMADVIFGTNQK